MPIQIRREQVVQLADAAKAREPQRQASAADLRAIFQPDFDHEAWLATCQYAAQSADWVGALFNQDEPVNVMRPFGQVPTQYALIAGDGSQIMPNRHAAVQYYFVQAATACIVYGVDPANKSAALLKAEADAKLKPNHLEFDINKLYENDELISASVVSNRRDALEIEILAERCKAFAEAGVQPIALADGSLVPFSLLNPAFMRDRVKARPIVERLTEALNTMRKAKALVAGYVDRPDSNGVVKAARLAGKPQSLISKQSLKQLEDGAWPMFDRELYREVLPAAQRGALFDPGWMVNGKDWLARPNHSVRACYVNFGTGTGDRAMIGRIEMPIWCAPQADVIAAVLYRQANLGNGYPFILKAAHEEAVVTREDQQTLETLIQMELRERGITTDISLKQAAKNAR